MAVLIANRKDLHRFSIRSDCHLQIHAIALNPVLIEVAPTDASCYIVRSPHRPPDNGALVGIRADHASVLLGNRLTVDPRTLTPLVLVRIQVPQPNYFNDLAKFRRLNSRPVREFCGSLFPVYP